MKKLHIKVQPHSIKDESHLSHSDNVVGDYSELDTIIDINDNLSDDDIEEMVDERLRYDYDLGYIYDNNLVEWGIIIW
jgi:hypothetical protein